MLIKHIAAVPENSSFSNEPIDGSVEEVTLTAYAKKALPLFEMLLSHRSRNSSGFVNSNVVGCQDSADILRLALNQLSFMITNCSNFDQTLNHYMATFVKNKLKEMYLVTYSTNTSFSDLDPDLPMKVLFCLNEGLKSNDAVNLGPLALSEIGNTKKQISSGIWPLTCMNPTLRLLGALERHDLSEIDVLLGCGVVFPDTSIYSPSNFVQLLPKQQHVALNCLFHAINWFFELLNCFTIMIKQRKAQKPLMRLRLVVWLMDQLSYCLPLTMEYIPPICYYQCSLNKIPTEKKTSVKGKRKKKTQKKRSGKKAKKSKQSKETEKNSQQGEESDKEEEEVDEEEEEDDNDDEEGDSVANDKNRKADLSVYSNYFRELDINVWLFLTQPLVFTPTPIQDSKITDEMGPSELLFILDDFVKKIEHKLPSSVKKLTSFKVNSSNQNARFDSIDTLDEDIIAKNTVNLLGNLCVYLEKTLEYTRNLIRESDEIYDSSSLFVPGTKEIKQCQNKIICIFSTLFAWHGFKDNSNSKLLIDGLQKMASKISLKKYKTPNKITMITDICTSLSDCAPKVLDIRTATALVQVMKTLVEHIDENDTAVKPLISKTCLKFLSRPWFDLDGAKELGSLYNKLLQILLQNYITCAEDQLDVLSNIITSVDSEVSELALEKDAQLRSYPVFSRTNINWLVDSILKGIEYTIKTKILAMGTSDNDRFKMWSRTIDYLLPIMNVVKKNDNRVVLRAYVKGSVNLLKLIKSHAISTFNYVFKECHNEVSVTLRNLQLTTRYLQAVCTFTKITRDGTLQHYLPIARSLMESIAFDIRLIFIQSNCTEAWYLGNMRHKNLKGEEILSQDIEEDADCNASDEDNKKTKKKRCRSDDDDDEEEEDGEADEMDVDNNDSNDEEQEQNENSDSSEDTNSTSNLC